MGANSETTESAPATLPGPVSFLIDAIVSLLGALAGAMLLYSLVADALSVGSDARLWGVIGFLSLAGLALPMSLLRLRPLADFWTGFALAGKFFQMLSKPLIAVGICSGLVLLVAHPPGLVPPYDELPILARRAHYFMKHGSELFEVSRTRFLAASLGFSLAWHSVALALTCFLQQCTFCGTPQKATKNRYAFQPKSDS